MPDLIVHWTPTLQNPCQVVVVSRHDFDWGTSGDLVDATEKHYQLLGDRLGQGSWFLCQRYTVYSQAASKRFFQEARGARSRWLKEARQSLSQRREARSIAARGRLAALTDLPGYSPELGSTNQPLPTLDRKHLRQVRQSGQIAKQMAFSGLMIIDGNHIDPTTWNRMDEELCGRKSSLKPTVIRRRMDLSSLKATGNADTLKAVALAELRVYLAADPDAALYVAPGVTVTAPTPSQAFLAEVRKRADEWHGKLYHALRREKKTLLQAADLPTLMLAYCGTLVIHGQCYIPGCWPDENPSKARLKRTPFQGPTVPLDFLGLDHPPHPRPELLRCDQQTASVDPRHDMPENLNEMFKTLLTPNRGGPS